MCYNLYVLTLLYANILEVEIIFNCPLTTENSHHYTEAQFTNVDITLTLI